MNRHKKLILEVAKTMPELRHTVGEKFDPSASETSNWLVNHPNLKVAIGNVIFDIVRGRRKPASITFNPETKTWKGVNSKE